MTDQVIISVGGSATLPVPLVLEMNHSLEKSLQ